MRIALAASEYHRGGGFPRHAAQLATALRFRGHSVTVYTRRAEPTALDEGITFRPYRTYGPGRILPMVSEPYVLSKLLRRAAFEFDVAICVGMACLAPVVLVGPGTHRAWYEATTSAAWGGTPFRRAVERFRPFHWAVLLWEARMLKRRHPRLIVVPTETGVADYVGRFDFPRERIVVIPHGVERAEFSFSQSLRDQYRRELGISEDTLVMTNVANRGRQKGHDVLVEALGSLRLDHAWQFLFAGSGSTLPDLKRRAEALVNQGRVRMLGRVPSTRALYCAADMLVFPSRFDPWGYVVTEALACGLPVLASRGIGSATAVMEGENGELIEDPADARELTAKISGLLGRARSFSRESVSASVERFDHFALAADLEQALMEVASAKSP